MHYPLRLLLSAPPWITDPDARDFIQRVESADGAALEDGIKLAYADFIRGCKADGNWNAIMAACILAAARTLSGALVPLVGTAPTNFNFVSGDYNRKTGLVGDGTTKYLNSNRSSNADGQNNNHIAAYVTTAAPATIAGVRVNLTGVGDTSIAQGVAATFPFRSRLGAFETGTQDTSSSTGLLGVSRDNASSFTARSSNATQTISDTSTSPGSINYFVHGRNNQGTPNHWGGRLAFYSIGESLNLALLDARVTTLINAIAAAIP